MERSLRQDKYGCYYWAEGEPTEDTTQEELAHNQLLGIAAEAVGFPTLAPPFISPVEAIQQAEKEIMTVAAMPKRTRSPRKAKSKPALTVPPPPPV